MAKNPTVKDVAEKANVSVATVSRVLNGLPGFSPETKEKVQEAIDSLGYQCNIVARNLKTKKSNIVAVLLPKVETTFYVKILDGIEDAAQKQGYNVMMCHVGVSGNRTQQYIKMLMERQTDGIIGCSLPPKEKIDALVSQSGIPCVLVSTLSPRYPIPYIRVDDFQASYKATAYLIEKGHRKIAMLSGSKHDMVAGRLRLEGYRKALEDHAIPYSDDLVRYTGFIYEKGIQAMKELIKSRHSFTGVVACCDEVAAGAMTAASLLGCKVPDDFSIIGYDNTRTAKMTVPQLTTVAQPLYRMGREAFAMLKMGMEHQPVQSRILPFKIVERDSVRKI